MLNNLHFPTYMLQDFKTWNYFAGIFENTSLMMLLIFSVFRIVAILFKNIINFYNVLNRYYILSVVCVCG